MIPPHKMFTFFNNNESNKSIEYSVLFHILSKLYSKLHGIIIDIHHRFNTTNSIYFTVYEYGKSHFNYNNLNNLLDYSEREYVSIIQTAEREAQITYKNTVSEEDIQRLYALFKLEEKVKC